MSTIALILVVVFVVALLFVVIALGQLWTVDGGVDSPVGSRLPRSQQLAAPSTMPGQFRSLMRDETSQWSQPHRWEALVRELNRLEAEFGGVSTTPVPEKYSAEWLDERVAQIEALAGPLPEPLRPNPPTARSRWPWRKS